jgi:8-oxo-dGTP pyrophosphatase MutT (NUDIX family)
MYKVFDKEKCTLFVPDESEAMNISERALKVKLMPGESLIDTYRSFRKGKRHKHLIVITPDVHMAWNEFGSLFHPISAAGGRVHNSRGEVLFIFRSGKWDLPKGKIERDEEVRDAAVREVEEECGIRGLAITNELPSTFHIYTQDQKEILKRTYWFEMFSDDQRPLVPQEEEGITEVKWLGPEGVKNALTNTYESIIEVMNSKPLNK